MQSEMQVRLMLDALKQSTDSRENIERARQYLRGVVGDLVRRKKIARKAIEDGQQQILNFGPPPQPQAPAGFVQTENVNNGFDLNGN